MFSFIYVAEVQTIDCVPGQIMYNCFYIGTMFLGPMPYPPPPPPHHCTLASTMLTVKHWWHWKTVKL